MLVVIVSSAALLGFAAATAQATLPVVHVYDVQVTGALRATLATRSQIGYAYAETSRWTATYKGVRLEVRTSESWNNEQIRTQTIAMRMESKGTVTGSIKYSLSSPRNKSCGWSTNRPEPGSLYFWGAPGGTRGGTGYRLSLSTGRQSSRSLRPSNCPYFVGNPARFTGARVGSSLRVTEGLIDTRHVFFTAEFGTAQQPGQLGFPLNRLHAGAGFVLDLKGKTKDHSGLKKSEGTVRITFVPRPS